MVQYNKFIEIKTELLDFENSTWRINDRNIYRKAICVWVSVVYWIMWLDCPNQIDLVCTFHAYI